MMLQSATTIGALPKLRETPSWLPVDLVARSIFEIATTTTSSSSAAEFFNVTNPQTFRWTEDLLPALRTAGLEFEEVEPREWVRRLRAADPDPVRNPPVKLLDFFASKYDRDEMASSLCYDTGDACAASPSLAGARAITQNAVDKFVRYFRDTAWRAAPRDSRRKTVVFVSGPSGSGKDTVGRELAEALGGPFVEGGSVRSKGEVEKMLRGEALTDEERKAWVRRVAHHALEVVGEMGYDTVVVSCAASKRSTRDMLRECVWAEGTRVVFLDLQCGKEVLVRSLEGRKGHCMSTEALDGELAGYEGPGMDELDILPVDAEGHEDLVVAEAKWLLHKTGVTFEKAY